MALRTGDGQRTEPRPYLQLELAVLAAYSEVVQLAEPSEPQEDEVRYLLQHVPADKAEELFREIKS